MNYEIKISGNGTPEEIIQSLKDIASNLGNCGYLNPFIIANENTKSTLEDNTLCAEITVNE